MRDLREHGAFVRDAVGHDDVEGGNAVAGDEQETVTEVKHFADFAGADFFYAREVELQNGFVHGVSMKKLRQNLQDFQDSKIGRHSKANPVHLVNPV
jgi:hypothetical protein